jgi:hypothetical protein
LKPYREGSRGLSALPMRSALRGFLKRCGSGSISRVLSPRKSGGVIIPLAPALLTGSSNLPGSIERAALERSPIRSCSGWGLPCRLCHQRRGELLPRLFTLTPRKTHGAVCFLWHFPWGRPRSPLATTLPCGARTFLPLSRAITRPPSAN